MADGQSGSVIRGRPVGESGAERDAPWSLRVLDVLDHPHGGRILRVRLQHGDAPTSRTLKDTTLRARGPRGQDRQVRVRGFALTGGKLSDERIRETGRVDLHVEEEGDGPPVDLTWILSPV
jgi:hypothetical protein